MDWNRAWKDAIESLDRPFGESFTKTTVAAVRTTNGKTHREETFERVGQGDNRVTISLGRHVFTPGVTLRLGWPVHPTSGIGHPAEKAFAPRQLIAVRGEEDLIVEQASIGDRRALHGPVPLSHVHLVRFDLGVATAKTPLYLPIRNAGAATLECILLLEGTIPSNRRKDSAP